MTGKILGLSNAKITYIPSPSESDATENMNLKLNETFKNHVKNIDLTTLL